VSIGIAWIGEGAEPDGLMAATVAALAREYSTRAARVRLAGRPEGTWDQARRQHASRTMLAWLTGQVPAGRSKLLGVTDVDLFIPVLTFVFGEAQLGGQVALVSLARLRDGPAPDLGARLIKEAVHEVGHTFGLVHCASPSCVMTRSPGLAAVDRKLGRLCADCRLRYHELATEEHARAADHTHPDR
jgi:archaemetzincin